VTDIDVLVLIVILLAAFVTYVVMTMQDQIQRQWTIVRATKQRAEHQEAILRTLQAEINEMKAGRRNLGRRHLDKPQPVPKENDDGE
jgi:type II secretory pathway pseudopilin PulG